MLREPELLHHQRPLWQAFELLMPSRPLGFGGVGAIPTLEILAVADLHGFDRLEFLDLCRQLDAVYMARANKPAS